MSEDDDSPYYAEVVVTPKRPGEPFWTPPKPLFVCLICEEPVAEPDRWRARAMRERPPICRYCAAHAGMKNSGPVWNRHNYHALAQVKAMINCLQWEIINGRRHR